jgi:septal ring factor EnvC (AmiA/AmiB activator)
MRGRWRTAPIAATVTTAVLLGVAAALPTSGTAQPSLGQLSNQLGQQKAQAQSLSARVGGLSQLVSSLDGQIALVHGREAAVRADLAADRAKLASVQAGLARERRTLAILVARLNRARSALAGQLISSYEGDRPDIVRVVLEAHGFTDLLERVDFLRRAEQQQQSEISATRTAKAQADAAASQLAQTEDGVRRVTASAATRAAALAGMNQLLQTKQAMASRARAIQQQALQSTQARAGAIQGEISQLQAQQAAAAAAAQQQAATQAGSGSGSGSGAAAAPSGGWAIPYAVVQCESGGQNLPPNSAGASGYYQILPSTWVGAGGTGPAAYLASKAEQDAVAARLWNGGAGASNWVCAGLVGIH